MSRVRGERVDPALPEESERRRRQSRARVYIDARLVAEYGVDETAKTIFSPVAAEAAGVFRELLAILGLDEQTEGRQPGFCACGAELPASTASYSCGSNYRAGKCWACSAKLAGT